MALIWGGSAEDSNQDQIETIGEKVDRLWDKWLDEEEDE